jgi:hypothetical protein
MYMYKKSFVVALLLGSSIFAMSTGAQAATPSPYPSTGAVVVAVAGTPKLIAPGTPVKFSFAGYASGENTTASSESNDVHLALIRADVHETKAANTAGEVSFIADADVPGTYTIRVVGENGNTATAQLVITPVDADGNFITDAASSTDSSSPLLAIWISAGMVLLIIALIITLATVRRKRLAAN